jgi:hypothetical protein
VALHDLAEDVLLDDVDELRLAGGAGDGALVGLRPAEPLGGPHHLAVHGAGGDPLHAAEHKERQAGVALGELERLVGHLGGELRVPAGVGELEQPLVLVHAEHLRGAVEVALEAAARGDPLEDDGLPQGGERPLWQVPAAEEVAVIAQEHGDVLLDRLQVPAAGEDELHRGRDVPRRPGVPAGGALLPDLEQLRLDVEAETYVEPPKSTPLPDPYLRPPKADMLARPELGPALVLELRFEGEDVALFLEAVHALRVLHALRPPVQQSPQERVGGCHGGGDALEDVGVRVESPHERPGVEPGVAVRHPRAAVRHRREVQRVQGSLRPRA